MGSGYFLESYNAVSARLCNGLTMTRFSVFGVVCDCIIANECTIMKYTYMYVCVL